MCQKYSSIFSYTDICIYIIMGHIWHIWYCWYIYNCTHTVVVDLWIVQAEPALLEPGQNDADHEWVSCFAIGTWCLKKCHKMLQEFCGLKILNLYSQNLSSQNFLISKIQLHVGRGVVHKHWGFQTLESAMTRLMCVVLLSSRSAITYSSVDRRPVRQRKR